MAPGDFGDLVESMVDRIGAYALRKRLELNQVLLDLPRIDRNVWTERVLIAAKWGIRNAGNLLARGERRLRHFDRRPEPTPGRNDRRRRQCEERRAHSRPTNSWLHPIFFAYRAT